MYFETFLGLRYLKAKRKQSFISVITLISISGVMMGVIALIVVLSVMNGARSEMMSKILGVSPHLQIVNRHGSFDNYEIKIKELQGVEGLASVTPSIYDYVILNSPDGISSPAALKGIDIKSSGMAKKMEPMIENGTLASLNNINDGMPSLIIGFELARQIGVKSGDILTVTAPQGKITPLGRTANSRKYRITGLLNSGYYEYDLSMVLVSLKGSQALLGLKNRVTRIEVWVKDADQSTLVGRKIQNLLGASFRIEDWKERVRTLFIALKQQKMALFIITIMIVLVAALNIISTLVMVVMEKTREIAVLRAMGATKRSVMFIFMLQGLFIGIVGTLAGLISGRVLCHLLGKYKFIELPSDIYIFSKLPVRVESLDLILVTAAAVVLSFIATLYPSWHASRSNPVEALRYE